MIDEFSPGNASSDDDEETIAKAEAEEATNVKDEVAALQKESEMELDAFLSGLPKDYLQNRDKIVLSDEQSGGESVDKNDQESDDEFKATGDSGDDEDTIMEQEKNENQEDHRMEIEELNVSHCIKLLNLMLKLRVLFVFFR